MSYLDLSLRGIRVLGLAAAICRTLVAVTAHRAGSAPPSSGPRSRVPV
jgi:hypothetical protein